MDFVKVINPGSVPVDGFCTTHRDVFCEIEYTDGRLSIHGVIGPKSNGDAWGGAGQINMEFAHRDPADNDDRYASLYWPDEIRFAPGWDADLWLDFLDVWKEWHLNDMRAECEHQRALGWREKSREKVTIYHWRLNREVSRIIRDAENAARDRLRLGETVTYEPEVLRLLTLKPTVTTATETSPSQEYVLNGPQYDGDNYNRASETKTLNWLRPDEHPDGLLGRPCPECGYGYGTAWQTVAVPLEVLDFLRELPAADREPAWV